MTTRYSGESRNPVIYEGDPDFHQDDVFSSG